MDSHDQDLLSPPAAEYGDYFVDKTTQPFSTVESGVLQQPWPPNYVVAVQAGLSKNLHPHSFLAFSLVVTIGCGIWNVLTLICGIPAVTMSVMSSVSSRNGSYSRGKTYSNVSAGLSIGALLCGMMLFTFVGALTIVLFVIFINYCGISGKHCDQDFWGRPNIMLS